MFGVAVTPVARASVTRRRYAVIFSARVLKVSVSTTPSASVCPFSDVRRIVSSPNAQVPMRHHRVSRRLAVRACISTSIQVPAGVSAFHEEMSCENEKPGSNQVEVQVPRVPFVRMMQAKAEAGGHGPPVARVVPSWAAGARATAS